MRAGSILILAAASLAAGLFCCGCVEPRTRKATFHRYLESPPDMRVLVEKTSSRVSISMPAGSFIRTDRGKIRRGTHGTASTFARKGSVHIGGKTTGSGRISILPPSDSFIRVEERTYPGEILLFAEGNVLSVVNKVNLEDYVAGVVAGEMPLGWDNDALCAQAVAARSYALYSKKTSPAGKLFDVHADEKSQVYIGAVRDEKALRAASTTRGAILVRQWRLFPTYYHSACGGKTRKAFPDFEPENLVPLTGVTCPYCADARADWENAVPEKELRRLLSIPGKIEKIEMRRVRGRTTVRVAHAKGIKVFKLDEFRRLMGPRKLRSPRFRARRSGRKWIFSGCGFGHGVGMCQWGARGMARKGFAWPSILRFYYPGADLIRIY